MEQNFPGRTLTNPERKDIPISPLKDKIKEKYGESVAAALESEIVAAENQAKSWCSEEGNRCNKVNLRVKSLDEAGVEYMKKKNWTDEKIIKSWFCYKLKRGWK